MSLSILLRWAVVLGMLAAAVRLALLSLGDAVSGGEVAAYYVAFFILVSGWRAAKFWRAPLLIFGPGAGLACLGLYCVGLALLIGLKYEAMKQSALLPTALFLGATSAGYFGFAVLLAHGRSSLQVMDDSDGRS
ncbi:hypothetical protein [Pseudomonas sp. CGJS7]|uniref:hypothetical protein n=1 Tax=Pseudomonas sp. CGJS7 TaxID=3109348 RepID=UPI003007FADA